MIRWGGSPPDCLRPFLEPQDNEMVEEVQQEQIDQPAQPAQVLGSAQYTDFNKTRKTKITKIPNINKPPENLKVFCQEFEVAYAHRRFFEAGVIIKYNERVI